MSLRRWKGNGDMHHYLFLRFLHGNLWLGLLGVLVVVGIVLLIVFLTDRKYKTPAKAQPASANGSAAVSATHERILAILSEQKNAGSMGAAEFEERRLILEGGKMDNHANADLVLLKERYARGELTTSVYVQARNTLLGID